MGDAFLDGRPVELQDVGHHGGVGHAVVGVVQRATGWDSACMPPRPFWNAVAPIAAAASIRARASRSAGVRTARTRALATRRMPSSAMPPLQRVKARGAIGFQAMGEGIHAGAGSDFRRHADGQGRVTDDHPWHHFRMEDDALGVGTLIDDHRRTPDFRAGAGGGRTTRSSGAMALPSARVQ